MIAKLLDNSSEDELKNQSSGRHDYGLILLRFLLQYSDERNLNNFTTLKVANVEVGFKKAYHIESVRKLFHLAYDILIETSLEYNSNIIRRDSTSKSDLSKSYLGRLLDVKILHRERLQALRSCQRHPKLSASQRRLIGRRILDDLIAFYSSSIPPGIKITVNDLCLYDPNLVQIFDYFYGGNNWNNFKIKSIDSNRYYNDVRGSIIFTTLHIMIIFP
jgi:hypothetical protein